MIHLLLVVLGVKSNAWAVLWGGFLSCLSMFAAAYSFVRHKNCEVHGCWRLGRHTTDGGHNVCRHHHPDGAPTHHDVLHAHHEAAKPEKSTGRLIHVDLGR